MRWHVVLGPQCGSTARQAEQCAWRGSPVREEGREDGLEQQSDGGRQAARAAACAAARLLLRLRLRQSLSVVDRRRCRWRRVLLHEPLQVVAQHVQQRLER